MNRLAAAVRIWRGRNPRSTGDRAFVAYALVLGILVIAAPVARASWLLLDESTVARALRATSLAEIVALVVLPLWSVALLVGTRQGPAALSPFLVFALAGSDLPRKDVFRRPLAASLTWPAGLVCTVGAAIGIVGTRDDRDLRVMVVFAIAGAAIGVMTGLCALIGQAYPRSARVSAASALLVAFIALRALSVLPRSAAMQHGTEDTAVVVSLVVLAAIGCAIVPTILERLDTQRLAEQALRWDTARAYAFSLDVSAAGSAFRTPPTRLRRFGAVRTTGPLWLRFFVRDAVGAARAPSRLATGLALVTLGGVALVGAVWSENLHIALGLVAGLLAYVGCGALTDGLRHATDTAADLPLYGISDLRLLAAHTCFPFVLAPCVLGAAQVFGSIAIGGVAWPVGVVQAVALGFLAVGARVADALRGTSPMFLLTPAPSALGDPMPLIRVLWALDGPILAGLAGLAVVRLDGGALPAAGVAALLVSVCAVRWVRRP